MITMMATIPAMVHGLVKNALSLSVFVVSTV
jgi:hypothetical protein